MYDIKLDSFSFSDYQNIVINSVEGLCPPGATISTQKMGKDGTKYQGSTKNERNIVINFSITYDVKNARKTMYNNIIVGDEIRVDVDGYKTIGYVENFELNNFQQLTTGQISIICPSSYFYEDEQTLRVTQATKTLTSDMQNDYVLEVEITADGSFFKYILNDITYTITTPLISGQTLTIDSYNRKIFVGNQNRYSSKDWLEWGLLQKGDNTINYEFDGSCTVNIKYKNRYLGI